MTLPVLFLEYQYITLCDHWSPVSRLWVLFQAGTVGAEENTAVVPDLEEGKEYEFRVIPVNQAGPGLPSDACSPIFLKSKRGNVGEIQKSVTAKPVCSPSSIRPPCLPRNCGHNR